MDGFKMFYFILELDKVFSLPRPLWPQKSWQLRSRVQPKRKIFHRIDFHNRHNDHHDHLGSGQGWDTSPRGAVPGPIIFIIIAIIIQIILIFILMITLALDKDGILLQDVPSQASAVLVPISASHTGFT